MVTIWLTSIALAASLPAGRGATQRGLQAFASEDGGWVPIERVCTSSSDGALVYLVEPPHPDAATALHVQSARDGQVSQAVPLGPARVSPAAASERPENGELHQSDCGAGSCWDGYERALPDAGVLYFQGRSSNYYGDWTYTYEVQALGQGPAAKDGIGSLRFDCPGGRLYAACVTPGWRVVIQQSGDRGDDAPHFEFHYSAVHLRGRPSGLDITGGALLHEDHRYRFSFPRGAYTYALSVEATPERPNGELVVSKHGKPILREACTALEWDPDALDAARSTGAKRGQR